MNVEHFVRQLKLTAEQQGQLAFFVGAGCSISSGIPGAATLVKDWLPKLHYQMTGEGEPFDEWVARELPRYKQENPAASYASVMRLLFPQSPQRQREVERFALGKDPAFGYAVLAGLMTPKDLAPCFNLVLTTNFDDLVADALYLFTQRKPLVVAHESLAGFVETGGSRPLVIKLHGDALLEPKSLEEETAELDPAIQEVLTEQLRDRGLVFVGYGGNDRSISGFLKGLPANALKWGVYWVNKQLPETDFGEWLESRADAFWIEHLSFDELMVLVFQEFHLSHPDTRRFDKLMTTYGETFSKLSKGVEAKEEGALKDRLVSAVSKTAEEFKDWWSVEIAARKVTESDPEEADRIYSAGIERFPQSLELQGNYANFLCQVREKMDEAESYYRRALEADPTHAGMLGNYAVFLKNVRQKMDEAESYYQRALEADPTDADILGNYASFLKNVRQKMDEAESYYQRALEADPTNATNLGNYANFLWHARKKMDEAASYYQRAIEADPTHAHNLSNYAGFLLSRGNTKEGLQQLERAIPLAIGEAEEGLLLECQFYRYAHAPEAEHAEALCEIRVLLEKNVRSRGWDLTQNIERTREDGHPNIELLEALAKVISQDADLATLDPFDEWQKAQRP